MAVVLAPDTMSLFDKALRSPQEGTAALLSDITCHFKATTEFSQPFPSCDTILPHQIRNSLLLGLNHVDPGYWVSNVLKHQS